MKSFALVLASVLSIFGLVPIGGGGCRARQPRVRRYLRRGPYFLGEWATRDTRS